MSQGTNSLGFGSYYFLHTQEPTVGTKLHEEVGHYTMSHCRYIFLNQIPMSIQGLHTNLDILKKGGYLECM